MKAQSNSRVFRFVVLLVLIGLICPTACVLAGEMRGTFVRLTEVQVAEREYLGIVVQPVESDDHVTVVVPRRPERLRAAARQLQPRERMEIAYVEEAGHKWIKELVSAGQREREGRRPAEREREVQRDRRSPEAMWAQIERLQAQVRELQAQVRRLQAQVRERPDGEHEGRRTVRREREQGEQRRERAERPPTEREVALQQIEILKTALHGLKEAERGDAAELLARAREIMLEGRRDERAQRIREQAPNRDQLAELLSLAAKAWREFGHRDKAAAVGKLAEQMNARRDRGERETRREGEEERRSESDRDAVHMTVRAGDEGHPQVLFREKPVSMEQLHRILRELGDERLLFIHVRGEISEEMVKHMLEQAREAGIQRIKVEHIKRKVKTERD